MPIRVQDEKGVTHVFPDGSTPEMIAKAMHVKVQNAPPAPSTDLSGRTPTGEPAEGDRRNKVQRLLDNLITPDPRREEWQGGTRTGVDAFARGVAENVVPLVSHPIESAKGLAKTVGHAAAESHGDPSQFVQEMARPMVEGAVSDYVENGPAKAIPHIVGQGVGMAATGKLQGEALRSGAGMVKRLAPRVSESFRTGAQSLVGAGERPVRAIVGKEALSAEDAYQGTKAANQKADEIGPASAQVDSGRRGIKTHKAQQGPQHGGSDQGHKPSFQRDIKQENDQRQTNAAR